MVKLQLHWNGVIAMVGLVIATAAHAAPDCIALKDQRDRLASRAMQSEITLLHNIRLQICPREEELAATAIASNPERDSQAIINYDAYIVCRRKAETRIERSRPVLYRNHREFTYYTVEGARLAREADAVMAPCIEPER